MRLCQALHAAALTPCHPHPPLPGAHPQVVTTDDMRAKLALLRSRLATLGQLPLVPDATAPGASSSGSSAAAGGVASWREFWQSDAWGRVVDTHNLLTHHGFATLGTQAAAVALWALIVNWRQPQQAVVIAAALGGNSSTAGALTGETCCCLALACTHADSPLSPPAAAALGCLLPLS